MTVVIDNLLKLDVKKMSKEQILALKAIVERKKMALMTPKAPVVAHVRPRLHLHKVEDTCLICVGAHEVQAVDEWHRRLMKSKIDNKSKRYMIDMEREIVNKFDRQKNDFINDVMKIYKEKGVVSFEELNRIISEHLNEVGNLAGSPLMYYQKHINDQAIEESYRKLGYDRVAVRKMKRQADFDPKTQRLQELIDRSMSKVVSVPDEVVDKMKSMWMDRGSSSDIVRSLLGEDEERIKSQAPSDRAMRDALSEMWTKQRFIYQRIVRTESVNVYAKIQLHEWYEAGITEVERSSINDPKTCLLCRELASPGRNVYLVEDLLKEEYPVSFMSHPLCRCSYTPRTNFAIFDELEQELMKTNPPDGFDVARDLLSGKITVEDVPIEFEEQVKRVIDEAPPNSTISFVPDVTTHERWKEDMLEDLSVKYPRRGDALIALQGLIKEYRGKIVSYVTKDLEYVLISGFAADALPITSPVARLTAEQVWEDLSPSQRKFVEERYDVRQEEVEKMTGDGKLKYTIKPSNVSPLAEKDARSFFVENYIAFMVEPLKLLYVDLKLYDWLKNNFFSKEYLDSPVR